MSKATKKYEFKLPPKYFIEEELVKHLLEAQQYRFQNAMEMKKELLEVQTNLSESKSVWDRFSLRLRKNNQQQN